MRTQFIQEVFFKELEKVSEGRLKVESHWNAELATGYDALNKVGEGNGIDIAMVVPEYDAKKLPLHQLFKSYPLGPTGQAQVDFFRQVYQDIPEFKQELAQQNVVPILLATGYPVAFFARHPLANLNQMQGQKWRTASFWHRDFLQQTGAIPVTMPWNEGIFHALEKDELQGLMVNIDGGYQLNIPQTAPYILYSPQLWLGHLYIVAMNKSLWDSLSAQEQNHIRQAAELAYAQLGDIMTQSFAEQYDLIAQSGANIRTLSADELAQWQQATQYPNIQQKWAEEQEQQTGKPVLAVLQKLSALKAAFDKR